MRRPDGAARLPDVPTPIVVAIATPLDPTLVERIPAIDPRLDVRYDSTLVPPQRWVADHRGDPNFRRDVERQHRFEGMLEAAHVVLGVPNESGEGLADLVRRAPRLAFVQSTIAGAGQQVAQARLTQQELGRVLFATSAGVHATPLAEFALAGVLYFAKDFDRLRTLQESRHWSTGWAMRQVQGMRLLIVGLGAIGRETARLATSVGMHVTGIRRSRGEIFKGVEAVHSLSNLHALLPRTDVVVLALPATAQTDGLVDANFLAALPEGAVLVNVGRGNVVDEEALIDALRCKHLRGAVLDVTAIEPLPAESPLWKLDNVVLSPHTAALTADEDEAIVQLFCDQLRRLLAGQVPRNLVDTEHFY